MRENRNAEGTPRHSGGYGYVGNYSGGLPQGFACAPGLRIEAHERLAAMQFSQLNAQLSKIEAMMERLEKRLWLTVYGVAAVILAQAFQSILDVTP